MHKSENEKIDFILDEHERIFRKQGSLCMALGKGFLVIAILCGVATFCVSGLYLKSLCLSVACCCGVFSRIFNYYSVPEESRWICPYISRHLLSLNPLLACCRRYSRGER